MKKDKKIEVDDTLATDVLKMMKRSLVRIYALLIIFAILFTLSMIDSVLQRQRMIELIQSYEMVEETTESYKMETENGNNNYVGGDNSGEINNN